MTLENAGADEAVWAQLTESQKASIERHVRRIVTQSLQKSRKMLSPDYSPNYAGMGMAIMLVDPDFVSPFDLPNTGK